MRRFLYIFLCFTCLILGSCAKDETISDSNKTNSTLTDEDDDNTTATIDDNYQYKLPIIFHILYTDKNDNTQYVQSARLQTIINRVNDLFQGNIYGKSVNANVKFILANYDESGKKLVYPGVDYIQWTGEYPIDENSFMNENTNKYSKYLWEPNDYINIFLYNFKAQTGDNAGITLGVSHLPYVVKGDSVPEGLTQISNSNLTKANLNFPYSSSINSLYINDESSRYTQADKGANGFTYDSRDINVTIAHELGHYLGLLHVFTEKETGAVDSCGDTDYCKDTPSYNKVEYDDFLKTYLSSLLGKSPDGKTVMRRTNCDGLQFQSTNILDYSIGLGYELSQNQKQRIREVLYYSPLIPGPKMNRSTRATNGIEGTINLPIRIIK